MEGRGVRCVSTGEWVTAAETAECVLALDALGCDEPALELLTWVQALRNDDGSYWTGMVYPEEATYPPLERSSYTAGAMVLAADALSRTTPASGIFRGEGLPEPSRPHRARSRRRRSSRRCRPPARCDLARAVASPEPLHPVLAGAWPAGPGGSTRADHRSGGSEAAVRRRPWPAAGRDPGRPTTRSCRRYRLSAASISRFRRSTSTRSR